MKALEKDRNRRYESAAAFAADVQRHLADEPVLACPPSAVYRARKFARRNRGGVLAATGAAVALLLAVGSALVVQAAKKAGIPMRIGANSGSLPKHLLELAREDTAEALVEEALEQVRILERMEFHDFKISVKSSSVPTMIRAYRMLSERVPYPLHLGVTEAGTPFAGSISCAVSS